MALVSGFSASPHPFPPGPPAYSHSAGAEMDDDLLALLASDAFSLQSHRDLDLDLLSSLLAQSLPPNSSPPGSIASSGGGGGNWIAGNPPQPSQGWNGWLPSSSGNGGSGYHAPSTSFSAGAGGAMATPHGTPLAPTPLALASSPSTSFPFSQPQSSQSTFVSAPPPPPTHADWARIGREAGGCRAPAASRERGRERGGSIQYEQGWASCMPGAEEDAAMMDD